MFTAPISTTTVGYRRELYSIHYVTYGTHRHMAVPTNLAAGTRASSCRSCRSTVDDVSNASVELPFSLRPRVRDARTGAGLRLGCRTATNHEPCSWHTYSHEPWPQLASCSAPTKPLPGPASSAPFLQPHEQASSVELQLLKPAQIIHTLRNLAGDRLLVLGTASSSSHLVKKLLSLGNLTNDFIAEGCFRALR